MWRAALLLAVACRHADPHEQHAAAGSGSAIQRLHVDAPRLPRATGTLALDAPIFEIRSLAAIPQQLTTPQAFAADRSLRARELLDALYSRDVRAALLVVAVGDELRMVVVERPAAHASSDRSLLALAIGATTLQLGNRPIDLPSLAASIAQADVTLELAPEVTVQRLVEVAAAAGGELHPLPPPQAPVPASP